MRFTQAADLYIQDMRGQGRLNSDASERGYRFTLGAHSDDVENRDPRYTNRDDIKRTLRRWSHPNSQRKHRSVLISFYDWLVEEGLRKDNPARQTRRPRKRPPQIYRLTRSEVSAMLAAVESPRERRAIYLGICAGLRRGELLGLRGEHFRRPGFVHVSAEIAKGGRERWVPTISELEPVVAEIIEHVMGDEYVLSAQRWRDPGVNREQMDKAKHPSSPQALYYLVKRVAKRAGIAAEVHPHLMRHAFGDHIARFTGIKTAQALMGHATVGTTEEYVGAPTLDELTAAIEGFSFEEMRTPVLGVPEIPVDPSRGADRNRTGRNAESDRSAESEDGDPALAARLSPVLQRLFASPVLRTAAREMGA